MFKWWRKKKEADNVQAESVKARKEYSLSSSLEANIKMFKEIFKDDDTLIVRRFTNQVQSNIKCAIIFADGMSSSEIINQNIIQPITKNTVIENNSNTLEQLQYRIIAADDIGRETDIDKIIQAVLGGDAVLLVEGTAEVLIVSAKGWQTRAISEPETERVFRGPREGFIESMMVNISLIRRRLRTPDLKFKFRTFGTESRTKACICYIKGIVNDDVLNELNRRLDAIEIDAVLDTGYIGEFIRDFPFSPFKTIGSTERPDAVAGKLLEGRIAIILEGTPMVLTVPHVFIELFQSSEDYFVNFYYSSLNRMLRVLGFLITITVLPVYVALTTFHQEMIPAPLLLSIAAARQGMPFPSIIEAVLLLLVFEILRESGTRLPVFVGQTVSIVGALILGQAAVQARFVSSPMVIVVALAGITGLMIPRLKGAVIMIRLLFLAFVFFIGLYGYVFGVAGLLLHLFQMRSFGIPYMSGFTSLSPQDLKDTIVRAPWWSMKYRPNFFLQDKRRLGSNGGKKT